MVNNCYTDVIWYSYTFFDYKSITTKGEKMKKVTLGIVSTIILGLGFTGCTDDKAKSEVQVAEKKTYNIKLAMTWPSNFPVFGDSVINFKKMAEEMSDGRLQIRIDSKNKHKSPFGIFDMVKSGQYQMLSYQMA